MAERQRSRERERAMKSPVVLCVLIATAAFGQPRDLFNDYCGLDPNIQSFHEKRLDRVGAYDIISMDIELASSDAEFYSQANYEVTVTSLIEIDERITFFMP